ncbi:phiRv1 phage protein [Mycobacterium tuberculosis]|nr:phiRv1 phage protein [Mycobacterium tuberculosis]
MGGLCLGVPGRPRRQLAAGCVVDSFEPPVGAGGDAEGCADSSVCFRRTTLRFWLGAHGPQARIGASFDENRHCYRRSPRHLRRHLQAAQTNRQRNPQRRQRNPPVRGETNGAAGRRIAELERPKAKQRQQEGGDHGRQARYSGLGPMGPKPESERRSTKTDTAIGAALGISAGTYRRLKRIDNATRSELAAWAARHP